MSKSYLICTNCKRTFPIDQVYPRCDACSEPLEVAVQEFESGKRKIKNGNILTQTIFDRYADFFPFGKEFTPLEMVLPSTTKLAPLRFLTGFNELSLHEGFTPLIDSTRLASELGIDRILFKNETQNPTWSFKDRGTITALHHAISLGYKKIGTVSTGNMAVSVAAYGAKAGLETIVLVSATLPPEKIMPIAIYNPTLIKVDGDYGKLYFDSLKIGKEQKIYFMNSDVPFRVEGSKTIAFEICEQLNFEVPDFVVVPTSSGGNFRGILKGFEEFKRVGLIDRIPIMVCAQAAGCSPIYNAFLGGKQTITRVKKPDTICHAIDNPYPPSGNAVLRKLKEHAGIAIAVTDKEVLDAQKKMASIGIFCQPDSAVPLAAVKRLKKKNKIQGTIVCIVTGSGLKYPAALEKHTFNIPTCNLKNLNAFISARR